jgi:hypothetical protein
MGLIEVLTSPPLVPDNFNAWARPAESPDWPAGSFAAAWRLEAPTSKITPLSKKPEKGKKEGPPQSQMDQLLEERKLIKAPCRRGGVSSPPLP